MRTIYYNPEATTLVVMFLLFLACVYVAFLHIIGIFFLSVWVIIMLTFTSCYGWHHKLPVLFGIRFRDSFHKESDMICKCGHQRGTHTTAHGCMDYYCKCQQFEKEEKK